MFVRGDEFALLENKYFPDSLGEVWRTEVQKPEAPAQPRSNTGPGPRVASARTGDDAKADPQRLTE
jgi:hypothetical protein